MRTFARLLVLSASSALLSHALFACGGDDAPSAPGGTDAGVEAAAPIDAGTDAPADVGADTAVDVDAGPKGYCASLTPAPTFCEDFDQGTMFPPKRWDSAIDNGADGQIVATGKSMPNAYRSTVPQVNGYANSLLRTSVAATGTKLSVAFDYNSAVTIGGPFPNAKIIARVFLSNDHSFTIELPDGVSGPALVEHVTGSLPTTTPFVPAPPEGTWTRIALDFDTQTRKVNLTIGGKAALTNASFTSSASGAFGLNLGLSADTLAYVAEYDNVVIDVKP